MKWRGAAVAPVDNDQRKDSDGAPDTGAIRRFVKRAVCEEARRKEEIPEKEKRFTCTNGKKLRVARQVRGVKIEAGGRRLTVNCSTRKLHKKSCYVRTSCSSM